MNINIDKTKIACTLESERSRGDAPDRKGKMNFYEMGYSAYDSPKGHPIAENNKEFRKATKDFGKVGLSNAYKEFRRGWDKAQEDWNNSSAKNEWDSLWKEVCSQK